MIIVVIGLYRIKGRHIPSWPYSLLLFTQWRVSQHSQSLPLMTFYYFLLLPRLSFSSLIPKFFCINKLLLRHLEWLRAGLFCWLLLLHLLDVGLLLLGFLWLLFLFLLLPLILSLFVSIYLLEKGLQLLLFLLLF